MKTVPCVKKEEAQKRGSCKNFNEISQQQPQKNYDERLQKAELLLRQLIKNSNSVEAKFKVIPLCCQAPSGILEHRQGFRGKRKKQYFHVEYLNIHSWITAQRYILLRINRVNVEQWSSPLVISSLLLCFVAVSHEMSQSTVQCLYRGYVSLGSFFAEPDGKDNYYHTQIDCSTHIPLSF